MDDFAWDSRPQAFPAALCTFLHALRVGAPWTWALDSLAGLANGIFSSDGRVFAVPAARGPHGSSLFCVPMADPGDPEALTLFCSDAGLVAVASSHSLVPRIPPTMGPCTFISTSGRLV